VSPTRFARDFRHDVPGHYRRVLEEVSPELAERLKDATLVGGLHGFPGHRGYLRRPWGAGWALVGDAGYFKDPITAHGISDALRDAELLADAVAAGGDDALAEYERRRDQLSVELFDITEAIASLEWDNAGLKSLHRRLSDAMKHEVRAMAALFEERGEPARLGA
jgi:flavin-dependent dehydrogenase